MVDIALHKKLNRTRTVEGNSSSLAGVAYNAGNLVTITFPGARVERIQKNELSNYARGISTGQYANKDPRHIVYDWKKNVWTWKIKGKYIGTAYASAHNFCTDYKLIAEDGQSKAGNEIEICFMDQLTTVFTVDANFTWVGGNPNVVDYTIDLMEGEPR